MSIDEIEPNIIQHIRERIKHDYGLKYDVSLNGQIKTDFLNNLKLNENLYYKSDLRYLWYVKFISIYLILNKLNIFLGIGLKVIFKTK